MILHCNIRRTLTSIAWLGSAGVGLLLLPLLFSRAEPLSVAAQDDEPRKERKGKKDPAGEPQRQDQIERARDEIRDLQAAMDKFHKEMQKRQLEMQKRADELHKAMQRLRQMEAAGQPEPNRFPGGPGGAPPGGQGFPGGGGGFGGGNLEPRLKQVEQKVDQLLEELRGLRSDMKKAPKVPQPPRPNDPVEPPLLPKKKNADPRIELELDLTPRREANPLIPPRPNTPNPKDGSKP